jgi:hypothetical protein
MKKSVNELLTLEVGPTFGRLELDDAVLCAPDTTVGVVVVGSVVGTATGVTEVVGGTGGVVAAWAVDVGAAAANEAVCSHVSSGHWGKAKRGQRLTCAEVCGEGVDIW